MIKDIVIEAPAKVLIVDDTESRLAIIRRSGILKTGFKHVTNAMDAIALLKLEEFDAVFLDHDLETFVDGKEITGEDVAKELAGLPWKPAVVIIQSLNPEGATRIKDVLTRRGIRTLRIPITSMEEM